MRCTFVFFAAALSPACGDADPNLSPGDAGVHEDAGGPDCEADRAAAVNEALTKTSTTARRFELSARTYWLDTELYLERGERLTVSATGTWSHGTGWTSPDGFGDLDGCPYGALIGSLGLDRQDRICLGRAVSEFAPRAGPLFLKMNDGLLDDNDGGLTVEVWVENPRAALRVAAEDVSCIDWMRHTQREIEVFGQHISLLLPTDFAAAHARELSAAVETYDRFYRDQADLAGAVPFDGQRIRIVVDERLPYFGLAGNPIRYQPVAMAGPPGQYHVARPDRDHQAWLWVHELGHDFDGINRGLYQVGRGGSEGWPNLFSLYSLEQAAHPQASRPPEEPCSDRAEHLASGTYETLREDPWRHLCMLLEIRDQAGGWTLYRQFFTWYNRLSPLPEFTSEVEQWRWIRDSLNRFASRDVTPILQAYHVPL